MDPGRDSGGCHIDSDRTPALRISFVYPFGPVRHEAREIKYPASPKLYRRWQLSRQNRMEYRRCGRRSFRRSVRGGSARMIPIAQLLLGFALLVDPCRLRRKLPRRLATAYQAHLEALRVAEGSPSGLS